MPSERVDQHILELKVPDLQGSLDRTTCRAAHMGSDPQMCRPQVTMLEEAVIQKDSELRAAAASQREAGEALRRSGARAQKLEQDVAALQVRCLELQRAQSAAEEQQSDALLQLRQQVGSSARAGLPSLVHFWEVRSVCYIQKWTGTWRRCRRAQL